ncbi:MAG: phosphatidate cytidylyltransferase [Clostridia bacterium]|nr:phosphatidate cytidylyltransferase [Clostridia bacterium]
MAEQEEVRGVMPTENGNKKKKLTSLQQRVITAVCYVAVWALMCALKWCVPQGNVSGGWGSIGFDLVFTAVSVIGAYEFLRAIDRSESGINCKISFPQRVITIAFCAMAVPLFTLVEMAMDGGLLAMACAFTVYVMFLAATSVFDHKRSSVKGTIYCVFCMLYCGVLSSVLSAINHLNANSMAAILIVFMCPILTDTGAFIIGSSLKKFVPMKLAPQLSPNKTVIGAVGGLIGGVLGAIIVYYMMYLLGGINGEIFYTGFNGVELTVKSTTFPPLLSFVLVGLATAVMAQIGDLFESAIKRECGVKDMGKLLPGHGGVLDRFDSMLYCSVVVFISFGTII